MGQLSGRGSAEVETGGRAARACRRSSGPIAGLGFLPLLALVLTAGVSLLLPLAVRRVVDGFNEAMRPFWTSISARRWALRRCSRWARACAITS
jgi:hypothetical protein